MNISATGGAARTKPVMGPVAVVLLLGSLSAFGPLSMDLYLPAMPELARDLGVNEATAQTTMSMCMIGLAIGQLFAGPMSDRWGRRTPLLVGVAAFAILSAVCAIAPNIYLLNIARLAQGFAGAAGMVVARAMVRDLYSGVGLSRMLSLMMLVSGSAPIIAPLIGGELSRFLDWRGLFVVLAGIGLLLFVAALIWAKETLNPAYRGEGRTHQLWENARIVFRDRLFVGFAVMGALAGTAHFTFITMSAFVFQGEFGLSSQEFGWLFAITAACIIVGGQVNAIIVGKVAPLTILSFSLTLGLTATLLVLFSAIFGWGFWATTVGIGLQLFVMGTIFPNSAALALEHHARTAGTASAILGCLSFLAGAVVPPLVSLAGVNSFVMGATMVAAMAAAAGVFWVVLRPIEIEEHRDAAPQ